MDLTELKSIYQQSYVSFIFLLFCGAGAKTHKIGACGHQSNCGAVPSGGSRGESVSLDFPASRCCLHPQLVVPPSTFKVHHSTSIPITTSPFLSRLGLSWASSLPLAASLWLHWTYVFNPGHSPHLEILNFVTPANPFCHVHISTSSGD
jgi:hypothetical protein